MRRGGVRGREREREREGEGEREEGRAGKEAIVRDLGTIEK